MNLLLLSLFLVQGDTAAINRFVQAEMERQHIPGLSLAVLLGDRVLLSRGYGLANVELRVPASDSTVYQSGSMAKQFTAALVEMLVANHRLRLDDSIVRWFAEGRDVWRGITVRHLLTHTSGLAEYTDSTFDYRKDYTEDELVKFAASRPLDFQPGERWSYSNTGYVLLGALIHRVTGSFYGDLLRDSVFHSLGMKDSRIISEADIVPNRAAGYRLERGELKNQDWVAPQLNTTADGALYFSILDLVAWDRALRSQALLEPASWAQVFEPVTLTSGKHYPYGFGWSLEERAGQQIRRHGGSWQGFQTHLARFLGDDLTVIVLTNLRQANPEQMAEGIAALFNPKLTRPELAPIPDRDPAIG